MRSDSGRLRESYPNHMGRAKPRGKKHAGASLGFCWGFGVVVCLTFGLASFLMFSAGHFGSFSSGLGVEPAHGGIEDVARSRNLLDVEVTQIDADNPDAQELYAQAYDSKLMEEFGPFPSYLSDYESVTLSTADDGKTLRVHDDEEEEDDEALEASVQTAGTEEPVLLEEGSGWREHTVKNGETLSEIASAYGGITAQDIIRANAIKDADKLRENSILLIPITKHSMKLQGAKLSWPRTTRNSNPSKSANT